MHYSFDDAPRTMEQNIKNKTTLENTAWNKMFHPDEQALSFIFKRDYYKLGL